MLTLGEETNGSLVGSLISFLRAEFSWPEYPVYSYSYSSSPGTFGLQTFWFWTSGIWEAESSDCSEYPSMAMQGDNSYGRGHCCGKHGGGSISILEYSLRVSSDLSWDIQSGNTSIWECLMKHHVQMWETKTALPSQKSLWRGFECMTWPHHIPNYRERVWLQFQKPRLSNTTELWKLQSQ